MGATQAFYVSAQRGTWSATGTPPDWGGIDASGVLDGDLNTFWHPTRGRTRKYN